MHTAHTHIHTHPPFPQHSARTPTPKPQTRSQIHTLDTFAPTSLPLPLPLGRCGHLGPSQAPQVHIFIFMLSWAGSQQPPGAPKASRTECLFLPLSLSLLSLTCSTCPIFHLLHCVYECQCLPGMEPRAAAQKQLSCGIEPPRAWHGCLPSLGEMSRKEASISSSTLP